MSFELKYPDFAARMNEAADDMGGVMAHRGRNAEFARRMTKKTGKNVTPDTARRWFEGFAMPRYKRIADIAEVLCVSPEWLESGKEPKRVEPGPRFERQEVQGLQRVLLGTTEGEHEELTATISKLKRFKVSADAAQNVASVLSLAGVPATSNGSLVTIDAQGVQVQVGVDVVIPGEAGELRLKPSMANVIVIGARGFSAPRYAVIPAGLTGQQMIVAPDGGSVMIDGQDFEVTNSLEGVLDAI